MQPHARKVSLVLAGVLAAALACAPAAAQHSKTAGGMVINLGIVPAEVALQAQGHREAHPPNPPPGSQHLLITLDNEKTGKRIGDAEVVVEVTDPHGRAEKKPMLHTQAGGLPDYSELYRFAWPGKYRISVTITSPGNAKPTEAQFTLNHEF
jgi:hypothetical protein